MNRTKLEKNWRSRGYSFAIGKIQSGDRVNEAVHFDKDEIVLMGKGRYQFVINKKSFLQHGDTEVYIPAGSTHSIINLGQTDAIIYYGYKTINSNLNN